MYECDRGSLSNELTEAEVLQWNQRLLNDLYVCVCIIFFFFIDTHRCRPLRTRAQCITRYPVKGINTSRDHSVVRLCNAVI